MKKFKPGLLSQLSTTNPPEAQELLEYNHSDLV